MKNTSRGGGLTMSLLPERRPVEGDGGLIRAVVLHRERAVEKGSGRISTGTHGREPFILTPIAKAHQGPVLTGLFNLKITYQSMFISD